MALVVATMLASSANPARAQDCNNNTILDECDIDCLAPGCNVPGCGNSFDCDLDGVPDECQVPTGTVLSVWDDATGNWSLATNWCPDVVPDNGGKLTYEVLINGGSSIVQLDTSPVVDRLTLSNCARLEADTVDFNAVLFDFIIDSGARYVPNPGALVTRTATLSAGSISLNSSNGVGGWLVLNDSMSVTVDTSVTVNGLSSPAVLCGEDQCAGAQRGGTSPPVLRVARSATGRSSDRGSPFNPALNIADDLNLNDQVRVDVDDGDVNLAGDFNNHSDSPECFSWDNGNMTLTAGTLGNPQIFELAGDDFGASVLGFVQNFNFGRIVLNPAVVAEFLDGFDNDGAGQGSCEALYVSNLVLNAGSTLRLGDCNVYYQCLTAHPTSTVETPGLGNLIQVGTCQSQSSVPASNPSSETLLALALAAGGVWLLRRSRLRTLPG